MLESRALVGVPEFDSPAGFRVATDRQLRSKTMSEWESETHATTTVARNGDGSIRHIKCRAEYFEVKKTDPDLEDEYAEGVNAKFKFDVVDGSIAVLIGVKDVEDDAPTGYDTSLSFLRALPVAEKAVHNVPGIKEVQETIEQIDDELDRGATAAR